MILCYGKDTIPNTSAESPEITCICMEGYIRHSIDNRIKALFEEREDFALTSAILIGSDHVILGLFIQDLYHIPDDLGALLQIRIDEGNVITTGMLQSGIQTSLFSKITGERDDFNGTFLRMV